MKQITDIFQNTATLAQYAPTVDTSLAIGDLKAAFMVSWKQLSAIIPDEVLDLVATSADDSMLVPLRQALANRTLASNAIFSAYHQRRAGTDVFKYEVEQMQRTYQENYFAAVDTLLTVLSALADVEERGAIGACFAASRQYQLAAQCRIKSAKDFDLLYPIDLSYHFFFRTLPLQREVASGRMAAYYDRTDSSDLLLQLDLALAKKTVAKALRRFDILEFPPAIRNLFDESHASRAGANEAARALQLADLLDSEADALLADIDTLLDSATTPSLTSASACNRPDDKIILMP